METLSITMIALWICSVAGTLFTCYSFATFIQRKIENKIRLVLSTLFLTTGFLFFSAVGSILTGQAIQFTILSLCIIVLLMIIGFIFVYMLYKDAQLKTEEENKKDLR